MGKNGQNVIISTDGMRSVMNIIKKKKKKKKKKKYKKAANGCYKCFRCVYCSKTKSHLHESHLRIMVEAKTSLLRNASWKLVKDNNYN